MTNKLFDSLKWWALTGMPAAITFFGILGSTMGWEFTDKVLTIAVAFNTMLGAWLGVQSKNYHEIDNTNYKG